MPSFLGLEEGLRCSEASTPPQEEKPLFLGFLSLEFRGHGSEVDLRAPLEVTLKVSSRNE